MRRFGSSAFLLITILSIAAIPARAADVEPVPLYTSDDLDRMFGPAPGPSASLDKTRPEDWAWVERFIDRQYARVDADRQYDLDRRALDVAAERNAPPWTGYAVPWGLGYPASTWWNSVSAHYAASINGGYRTALAPNGNRYDRAMGQTTRAVGRTSAPRSGHGAGHGHAHPAR